MPKRLPLGLGESHPLSEVLPWWRRWQYGVERPMYLIVGRRGSGKTLFATEVAVRRMRRGEKVYANYPILDRYSGMRAGQIHSLMDCLELRDCTVVIDEANLWTSSREWSKIPPSVLSAWQQSRKNGVCFIFTAQHEERVDKVIRELCDWILLCERVPLVPKWVPLFRVQWTFLESISEVRRGVVSTADYRWVKQWVFEAYDTTAKVDAEMLDKLAKYRDAIQKGKDPDELGIELPPRIEPARWDDASFRFLPVDWCGTD